MKDLIGANLGQYEIIEKIGQGGMAHVFKAYQPSLDRYVAMKVLSPVLAEQPGFTERFQREAHSVASLNHPNILQVYDFGMQDNYNYLVMRYVKESLTLSRLIHEEVSFDKLIDYILQVADALNYAHEHGIVHRDVKPSNILIDGKWALLSDFGLVKMVEGSSQLTNTGVGIGTPAYMSPEQVSGHGNIDRRTDIYALGIILYRMLSGTIPHNAPTTIAMLAKRGTEPVQPLRQIKPTVSTGFEQVTMRSLAMDPESRYKTATDFAEALKEAKTNPDYQEPTQILTEQPTLLSRLPKYLEPQKKNHKVLFMAMGAAVAILALGALAFYLFSIVNNDDRSANLGTPENQTPESALDIVKTPPTDTPIPPTETPIPPGTPSAFIKTNLEVYSGPGETYDLLGFLPTGASVEITSRDQTQDWWKIKTPLSTNGSGWIKAGAEFADAVDTTNVPIALAPPTPTPFPTDTPPTDTPTVTSTPMPNTATPTPIATPTRPPATATSITPASVPTPKASVTAEGEFSLLNPTSLEKPTFGMTEFEWRWTGALPENQGFEVRVWRDNEPPAGVHNAVLDNQNGSVEAVGNDRYRLVVDITDSFGVKGRGGEYNWTVALVQIEPNYQDLNIQASPARLRYDAPGGGGGGGNDGGGGGGGINP